ncbi:type III pantothenate kinase [Anaerotruncus colihominis]|uniref:Type III pantothenate kinase n=2 Tax=Anaerotruncus colihominis TaxID=169435 RepID=B0P9I2_9FIRM|nr:type III pantothenate kinase [Anaerotruncus colihominis]EDS11869.1 pantothenate kinase, type III [Anaerotruncus colihominis DSM 17241]OUO65732.1 type III pantothenate kinase [Anaerotruncus colihominis]OUP67728.1 type III pantothenate kinase [Anaerotruncus colihominis]OUP72083.1 type III pantothenate kinase [Anaerotruncus colihominis]UOX67411.1 type III pantothenate kinase [Anaerotruncus colihominis]
MILSIDIGNSNINIGAYCNGGLLFLTHIVSEAGKTEVEYAVLLHHILHLHRLSEQNLKGAVISSVVPQLSPVLKAAVQLTSPVPVMQIGPGVKTGLNIRIDNPAQLGADFVAAAVGAFEKYPLPVIIVDFGTATKISIVDRSRSFIGGSIMPGVRVSLDALSNRAAQLPHISLEPPAPVIGTNTIDCMKSGVLLGNASMIDGMIERYEEKAGPAASIVATGESVDAVAPFCRHKLLVDKTLRLDGLYAVWKKNTGM